MAYFRNRKVNLLNLHYAIHALAATGGAAFFSVFLLESGVPVPGVLVSIGLVLLGRFAIRPMVTAFASRHGLRAAVVVGTLLNAVQYPFLAEVHGIGIALALLIAMSAIGETAYWTTYHAYFAALGDDELRGQQIGIREAFGAIIGIASPLGTGWMLVTFGPRIAFGTMGVIAALAALPILWAPEVQVPRNAPGAFKAAIPGMLLFAADGWLTSGYGLVWQIALFYSLRESILAYGGALALAALVGAVASLTLGRHIDAGHGKRAVWYATGTVALIAGLRAVATGNTAFAVLANALGAFGACLYVPTMMTAVYTLAKRSPCTLRFHVATEGGWDIGGSAGLLTAALLTSLGAPLSVSILLSLLGIAAVVAVLRRFYRLPQAAVLAS